MTSWQTFKDPSIISYETIDLFLKRTRLEGGLYYTFGKHCKQFDLSYVSSHYVPT